jgi:hypothetical protein
VLCVPAAFLGKLVLLRRMAIDGVVCGQVRRLVVVFVGAFLGSRETRLVLTWRISWCVKR